jgi:hypothetical protein
MVRNGWGYVYGRGIERKMEGTGREGWLGRREPDRLRRKGFERKRERGGARLTGQGKNGAEINSGPLSMKDGHRPSQMNWKSTSAVGFKAYERFKDCGFWTLGGSSIAQGLWLMGD